MNYPKIIAIILFILMYVLMIAKQKYRAYIVLATALIYIIFGILPINNILQEIDFNVLLMIAGTMVIVSYFIESKMPNKIADLFLKRSKNALTVTIYMSLFAGIISAFIDNVATVLMIAPVGLAIAKKINISPVNMLLAIALSSNLQGAATLVGDTTSIMLGAYAKMDFADFFFLNGKPSIFFAVELGAILTIPVMLFLFRNQKQAVQASGNTKVESYYPGILLAAMVITLIMASFIPNKPAIANGLICCSYAVLTMLINLFKKHDLNRIYAALKSIDCETLLLLSALFLVIGGIKNVGLIDDIANFITQTGGNNLFVLYSIIVWGSVLLSAFIDNIPYVATMLPILQTVSISLGIEPYLLYFGLLSGATLGGNITPIGASANIATIGILKKEGYEVSFKDFGKIGIPFTITAVTAAYIFIWLIWH